MLQGEDGSSTVWDHKEDELERAIFGRRASDSVHGEGGEDYVAHSSVSIVQDGTLSEHLESESFAGWGRYTERPQGAGSRENPVHSTSQSLQKDAQSAAVTEVTSLF